MNSVHADALVDEEWAYRKMAVHCGRTAHFRDSAALLYRWELSLTGRLRLSGGRALLPEGTPRPENQENNHPVKREIDHHTGWQCDCLLSHSAAVTAGNHQASRDPGNSAVNKTCGYLRR